MKIFFCLFSLLLPFISYSQNKEKVVEEYFKEIHSKGKFNGNVLIAKGDTIIYLNSFGFANGEKLEELSLDHYFGLGSIYKEFPAVAILQLQEMGLLSLEDSLSAYLPSLPNWSDSIKIKHLLNYSSGLPLVDWPSYFQRENGLKQKEIIADLATLKALTHKPGTEYIYSNYNPFLLIEIVETISGLSFQEYLQEKILKPHQITGIKIENKFPFESRRHFAIPVNGAFAEDNLKYELTTICATVSGLFSWIKNLDNFNIISKSSMQALSTKVKPEDNVQIPLGVCTWEKENLLIHEHHGSSGNYECLVKSIKKGRVIIVLLTNQKNRNLFEIADKVLELVEHQ